MKKIINLKLTLFILFIISICFSLQAQDHWRKVFPTVSGDITDVYFWDEFHGIIIGDGKRIGITYDGGATWERIRVGDTYTSFSPKAIDFINDTIGICVSVYNVYKTMDGGNTWSMIPFSGGNDCLFLNDQEGIAISNNISRTIDQGLNWSTANINGGNPATAFYGVNFINTLDGYAVGEIGQIAKTIDGGQNWDVIAFNPGANLNSVWMLNTDTTFAVGNNGIIVKTIDANNWTTITSGIGNNLNNISFFNDSLAIIIGDTGTILRTIDGGNSWTSIISGTNAKLNKIHIVSNLVAFIVGSNSTLLKTIDGGVTWSSLLPFSPSIFESCITTENNNMFAAGTEGSIMRSEDTGLNWQMLNSGTSNHLYSIHFPNDSVGYAVGEQGTILKTTDKGDNWINQISNTPYNLLSVYFIDQVNGYAVGGNYGDFLMGSPDTSVFLKTIDGGTTWIPQINIFNGIYRGVQFANPQFGYIVGGADFFGTDIMLRTTDGGNNWIDESSGSPSLYSIEILDTNNIMIGGSGVILKTTNSGSTWTQSTLLSGYSSPVLDVKSFSVDTGYCVFLGHALSTNDGWVTRTPETDYVGGDYGFRSIDFSNKANGIAVGERGSIFKYYENPCSVTNYSNYTYVNNSNGNVSFTNTSTGSFNQLNWAFGDGNTSSLTSPNHNFSANGTYVVVLTINDSVTSCLDYYTDTITVTGVISPTQCTAGFVIYPDTTTGDIIVINSSTGSNLTYLWDFGDGNTSTQAYPSYTYTSTGNFYLCLTIDDGAGCIDMYCDSIGENGVVFNKQIGFTINVIATPVITGIEENNLESSLEIEIYPNPALSQLTIDTELDISEIIIVDITGKMIITTKQNTNVVNVANLSNGIYFIKVITNEKTITKKFVKQ